MVHRRFRRNVNGSDLIELMLVAAIATILVIRLILELSGYPKIGGSGLHIAHALWGGLIMLGALIIVFTLLNPVALHVVALLGGVGFGFFIDEVGKLISADTSYFFQPAVAVMYVLFVLLFLVLSGIRRWSATMSPQDELANAMHLMQSEALTPILRRRILGHLGRADQEDPLVPVLRDHVAGAPVGREGHADPFTTLRDRLAAFYHRLCTRPRFGSVLVIVFSVYLLVRTASTAGLLLDDTGISQDDTREATAHVFQAISYAVSGLFILIGLLLLHRSRLQAYRWLLRGVLVGLFVCDVFAFFHDQFAALYGLVINLLLYAALRYMIGREMAEREDDPGQARGIPAATRVRQAGTELATEET
ncbi:MAG: hypothetical protein AB7V62_14865 [Thermoleophilia bacterium]